MTPFFRILRTAPDGSTALLTLDQALDELDDVPGFDYCNWCAVCALQLERAMLIGEVIFTEAADFRIAPRQIRKAA